MAGKNSIQLLRGSTSKVTSVTLLPGQPLYNRSTKTLYIGSGSGTATSTLTNSNVFVSGIKNDNVTIDAAASNNYVVNVTPSKGIKFNTLYLPTTAGGSTYSAGSSGKILKSNGTSVYWGDDNNTTYSIAKYNTAGLLKPAYSSTNAVTLTTSAATNTNSPTICAKTTTSDRYYAAEIDKNGIIYTNVPWTDTNTKVTQNVIATTSTSTTKYPLLLSYTDVSSTGNSTNYSYRPLNISGTGKGDLYAASYTVDNKVQLKYDSLSESFKVTFI